MRSSAMTVAAVAAGMLVQTTGGFAEEKKEPLLCYVGGTMRPAMEELAKQYKQKNGQEIQIDYADSGQLMVKIQETKKGDLYVSHDPFPAAILKKNLGSQNWEVAYMVPVIVVPKGNPKKIGGLKDLAKPGIKVVLPHTEFSTTGHMVLRMLDNIGIKKEFMANVVSQARGGSEAANAVTLGTADASVVWNAVAFLRKEKLDAIEIETDIKLKSDVDAVTTATYGKIDMSRGMVAISLLKSSKSVAAATAFAEFCASTEGQKVWEKFGFSVLKKTEKPEDPKKTTDVKPVSGNIFVQCAAGMRAPVVAMAGEFEKKKTPAYN